MKKSEPKQAYVGNVMRGARAAVAGTGRPRRQPVQDGAGLVATGDADGGGQVPDLLGDEPAEMTDEERAHRTVSELLDATRYVARVIRGSRQEQIVGHPEKIGTLLERSSNAALAAVEAFAKLNALRAENAAIVNPGTTASPRLPEADPLADALASLHAGRHAERT